ncbi:MAG: SCO family protein [Ahrensia sp.]|nr:SCO family protein [Ahrensia sp.]
MRSIFAAILIALIGAIGFVLYQYNTKVTAEAQYGVPFNLVTAKGDAITEAAFKGQPTALFFGFTNCPEICPTTLFELDSWFKELGTDSDKIKSYFITIDPERDTPEILGDYVASVTNRVEAISGNPDQVRAMASGFGVYYKRLELEGGDYTMDHTASVFLLDKNGAFRSTIAYGENSDTAVQKLRNLVKG